MKKFKYLLFAIIFLIMGCGTTNQINSQEWAEIGLDGYMIKTFDKIITPIQLDSLCIADTLSRSLDEWVRMSFYDTEAKTQVIQYLYIKTTTTETLYTVQEMTDSTYYVVCRTIKEDNIE
jgi:hypothetical protein